MKKNTNFFLEPDYFPYEIEGLTECELCGGIPAYYSKKLNRYVYKTCENTKEVKTCLSQ